VRCQCLAVRARSAFYGEPDELKPLHPCLVLQRAAAVVPQAVAYWHQRLASVTDDSVEAVLTRIPPQRLTPVARAFASALLRINRALVGEYLEARA